MLKYFVVKDGRVVDKRRVQSIAPTSESVALTCKNITLPNGDSLTFVTDEMVKRDSCFKVVVIGPVVRQDFEKFAASISTATLEADTSLVANKTSVTVVAAEEHVATDGFVAAGQARFHYKSV